MREFDSNDNAFELMVFRAENDRQLSLLYIQVDSIKVLLLEALEEDNTASCKLKVSF